MRTQVRKGPFCLSPITTFISLCLRVSWSASHDLWHQQYDRLWKSQTCFSFTTSLMSHEESLRKQKIEQYANTHATFNQSCLLKKTGCLGSSTMHLKSVFTVFLLMLYCSFQQRGKNIHYELLITLQHNSNTVLWISGCLCHLETWHWGKNSSESTMEMYLCLGNLKPLEYCMWVMWIDSRCWIRNG